MAKQLLSLFLFLLLTIVVKADFNVWGSAVRLHVNGTDMFYNTRQLSPASAIGTASFEGTIGVFAHNSGSLKILGGEINTAKTNGMAICNAFMFYAIYERNSRPVLPTFTAVNLSLFCNCNGTSFSACGGKACTSISDQKFQNVNEATDLTSYANGDYTIEIYYQLNGGESGNCGQQHVDKAVTGNYKANFSITTPLALNLVSLNGLVAEDKIKIKWVVQNDIDIVKYEVQKSENGVSFTTINTTIAKQLSTESNYVFTDLNPILGTNYYRVKAFNRNESVNLSKVFRIYYGIVGNTIFIYPNPSGNDLAVRIVAVYKGNYRLSVLNNNGQQIVSMPFVHDGIDKTIRVAMPYLLAKGIYRLFLIDKSQFYKQSFLIK
jgi:hypothetical protein